MARWKAPAPRRFSPPASWRRRRGGDRGPFACWAVGHQRLLDPVQAELGEAWAPSAGGSQVPALVDVDHQPFAGLERPGDRPQRAEVGLLAEADLDLEGAVARRARALDGVERGAAGIEARGIDRHRRIVRAAQRAPQRQAALARAQIVDGEVEAGRGGGERAGVAALHAQHVQRAVDLRPQRHRIVERLAERARRHDVGEQQRAMLGAGGREVAPDLAPAARAVGILDPHEHRDALGHGAERGADRLLDRRAEDVRFDAGEAWEALLFRSVRESSRCRRIVLYHARTPRLVLDAGLV